MDKTMQSVCDEASEVLWTHGFGEAHSAVSVNIDNKKNMQLCFKNSSYLFKLLGFVLVCPFQEVQ